jgi:ABC-type transporter MlaC component
MAIHVTRWSPDTCDCIIEYEWDDSAPPENRQHNLSNYVRTCTFHQSLATDSTKYSTVVDENTRKNHTLGLALDNGPASLFDESNDTDNDGNTVTVRTLKRSITFNWSWTGTGASRVLNVTFIGISLTNQQKNTIRNILNNRFGIGKVIIN